MTRRGRARTLFAGLLGGTLLAACTVAVQAEAPVIVHVANVGDDTDDGSTAAKSGAGKGPVRTIARAQALVQRLRAGSVNRRIDIALAGGTYTLAQPIRLGVEDSGSATAPITYRPELGASVTLSGGSPVGPWQTGRSGEWIAALNPHLTGGACPTQLFVGDQRRDRPRWPALGTLKIKSVPDGTVNSFIVAADDLPTGFQPDPGTEIVIIDAWVASRLRVAGYDPATHRIDLQGDFLAHGTQKGLKAGLPYYIENMPTGRLSPGHWRCAPDARSIHYLPLAGEQPKSLKAVVPRLMQLLTVHGGSDRPVHDVVFRDLTFAHAAWTLPAKGWAAMQAEVGLPAAVDLADCQSITLSGITVAHVGANAIDIRSNCRNVELAQSHLYDLGGGGVAVGSFQREPMPGTNWIAGDTANGETTDIRIVGNDIRALGRIQRAATGVLSGQASHLQIADNRISDLYYSGISLGWVWNDGPSLSHDNMVSGNVIDRYGQGVMSDMGGIYTLGRQDGTVISGNRISNGSARDYGGWGLYADQGSSGIRFDHNSISATSHAGIFVHMPGVLAFANDAVVNSGEAGIRCAPGPKSAVQFDRVSVRIANDVKPTQDCENGAFSFTSVQVTQGNLKSVLNKAPGSAAF